MIKVSAPSPPSIMPAVVAVVAADVITSLPVEPERLEVAVPNATVTPPVLVDASIVLKLAADPMLTAPAPVIVAVEVAAKSAAVKVAVRPVVALTVSDVTVLPAAESNKIVSTLLAAPVELIVAVVTPVDAVAVILLVPLFTVPPETLMVWALDAVEYA
jgi:hypothetical protein